VRWYVLRALVRKEVLRVASQRGAMGMALLMVVTAALFSVVGSRSLSGLGLGGDAGLCVVDYWKPDHWLRHLEENRPDDPDHRVEMRSMAGHEGWIRYPSGSVGIQLRPLDAGGSPDAPHYKVWVWYPSGQSSAATWCEDWFWTESRRFFLEQARAGLGPSERQRFDIGVRNVDQVHATGLRNEAHDYFRQTVTRALLGVSRPLEEASTVVPALEVERSSLWGGKKTKPREAVGMGLSLLALFFVGVFLLPSLTCEERERGTLMAIALSPASAREILAARMSFYFVLATGLALVVAVISAPASIGNPFLWASVAAVALGAVGVGMTIAAIAKTQRSASTGALLYLFATGVLLLTGKGGALEPLTWLMLERHGPEMLLAALAGRGGAEAWVPLGFTLVIAVVWNLVASAAYRRWGWR